jgi:NAD(P)-dependent dehydrogenase (short-subunit alcohol dehydrogenase family)
MPDPRPEDAHSDQARAAARQQREIQRQVEAADQRAPQEQRSFGQGSGAMQAGARAYPEPPFPAQHQAKPGSQADLELQPLYDAPYYTGSGKLQDRVAIITGADSGIGRAVAVLFAREGADVAVLYLDETRDAEDTRRAVEKEGRRCLLISGDVRDRAFCFEAVKRVVAEFGKLDVLVNNAAFQVHTARFEDLTEAHFDATLKTNLYGYFHMAQAAVPHMRPGSAIVNCGSVTGLMGNKDLLDYSTTKGGIHAFTRSLSTNLIPRGIRVNAVAPGPVWTPLNPSDKEADQIVSFGEDSPMKRPAQPEEIAPAFVFLASPQLSSYITGEILPVIGGYGSR